ncbi:OpgC domain-containing protein [Arthrobacter sp. M4]|uniref:OpgC domain-containing protein n=1 Tax=Arthrobacter sp. M4 TaxID=218160 RepID=UPI001CDCE975|nr:OpgC domain-containing protein [Arthrobacter sp. M4]MCA4134738.1 OpgC domain-containing protein [Arthrobacter sp. M4]
MQAQASGAPVRVAVVIAALTAVVLLLLLGAARPASAADAAASDADAKPAPGKPFLGAFLEWDEDDAAGFAERLQAEPALFGHDVSLPLKEQEMGYLREYLSQSAAAGAHALLAVKPTIALDRVDAAAATEFVGQLEKAAQAFKGKLLISFAPDMNSNWTPWGQQPGTYVSAYRAVAQAFKVKSNAAMVWQPFQGRGYPFAEDPAASAKSLGSLDTNHDGVLNGADDPFSPYYPGDDVVDWVGISADHDDTGGGAAVNTMPAPGELESMLTTFYESYAASRNKPLLVETAAYFSPSAGGAAERDIKLAWWQQALDAGASAKFPAIGAIVWDEKTNVRDAGDVTIDWRLTGRTDIAAGAAQAVRASTLVTGPVTEKSTGWGGYSPGTTLTGPAAWIAAGAVLLMALLLWFLPSWLPAARDWAYLDPSARDARVDMLRGIAIVFVVVNHVGITSLFQLFTEEAIGFVSGAELFVTLSGLVLGMVYGPKSLDNLGDVVDKTTKRAWKLYVTALVVVAVVFLISKIPSVHADVLTTFTDQGTGGAGRGAQGRTYDLYGGIQSLFQFPVSPSVVPAVLLLQVGPWQFNVMGLYVVMLLVSPLVLWMLTKGRVLWVLAVSLVLYVLGTVFRFRVLPSQFEDSFPLLVWQLLFIVGLVAGFHRRQLVSWLQAHRWVVACCAAVTACFAILSWANPYVANDFDVRLAFIPDASYRAMYDHFFGRTYLSVGRLLNVITLLVTAYVLLTAYWKPLRRAFGWLLIPLGQATLYVFIVHVALIAVISNIPLLQEGNVLLNTAIYAVIVALLWVMVRTRFLFRIIPT